MHPVFRLQPGATSQSDRGAFANFRYPSKISVAERTSDLRDVAPRLAFRDEPTTGESPLTQPPRAAFRATRPSPGGGGRFYPENRLIGDFVCIAMFGLCTRIDNA